MALVFTLVLLVAALAVYGWFVPSPYLRRFAGVGPADPGEAGFIRPREVLDGDEDDLARAATRFFVGDTAKLPQDAGRANPRFHEPHWGHTTGLLQGWLEIDAIDVLPEALRVGLFAAPARYPALCRVNYTHDRSIGLSAVRLAVKLCFPRPVPNVYSAAGEAHELDLLLAEGGTGVNGPGHSFFFRDAREMAAVAAIKPPRLGALPVLANWRNLGLLAAVFGRLRRSVRFAHAAPANETGWAGKAYYSLGPYALGPGAMKFSLQPRQAHRIAPVDTRGGDPTVEHRHALQDWVAEGEEAAFDLCVQIATPDCIPEPGPGDPPKDVMTAEYCDLNWDEAKSPFVRVGTLRLPASAETDLSAEVPWSPLQFNAWNTLPEMRPLGQCFRVRRQAHKAHSEFRLRRLYGTEPGAMVDRAPFPDAPTG